MKKLLILIALLFISAQAFAAPPTQTRMVWYGTDSSGACTSGHMMIDTDATSGQRVYVCESSVWVLQGDGGGSFTGGTLTSELVLDELGLEGQPTDAITDCSSFSATGGGMFYDDSEGKWKKCEDNVLSDLDTQGGTPGTDSIGTAELDDGADTPASGQYIRVDTVDQAGIEYRTASETKGDLSIDDLVTLSGVADGAQNLGTFAGTTISDNGTIKAGMQELETEVETKEPALSNASTTVVGKVELATTAEMDTGTDTTRAMGVNEFVDSDFGKRVAYIPLVDDTTDLTVKDGLGDIEWTVPAIFDGWDITDVECGVFVAGTTGTQDFQIHNVTDTVDVLSTKCTIDTTELNSHTAVTAPVINGANDSLATGDRIRFDSDAIQTTAAKGAWVELTLKKP